MVPVSEILKGFFQIVTPHDRTQKQSALIYSNAATHTAITIPTDARFARIVITDSEGSNLLVETAGGGTEATNCAIGSTLLLATGVEHFIPLPDVPSIKIAGESGTTAYQLSWCK